LASKNFGIGMTFFILFQLAGSGHAQQKAATLEIQAQKPIAKVSPMLYGLMTEEINYSYDGGLYAELVCNRSLNDSSWMPAHWTLRQNRAFGASIGFDKSVGPSAALKRSVKLNVSAASASDPAGVQNDGFWGVPLRPQSTYRSSFYAKADVAATVPVTVSFIQDETGAVLASGTSQPLTTEWKRYEVELHTGNVKTGIQNHIVLSIPHPGTVWFTLVSVFPPTYHDRPNGNRIDLMEKLAAIRPRFLRFPGGNYLEGDHIRDRFDWKKTIGPLVDRPTHRGPWGYQSSDGMGLLEFLEWCEDLNMEPVLGIYAGYSLQQAHVAPGADLEPYVQDALDEIEYITGSSQTKWGAVRASDGHPQPFHLSFVEIGNEDEFDKSHTYDARFAQFFDATKKAYPNIQIIATTAVSSRTPDLMDEHFYRDEEDFYADVHHYDETPRNGSKIFVGEWATLEGSPTPDFGAALSDAAWMTGLERNSDVVLLSSYAPLFVNVNTGGTQWRTNLIGYDAASSYGSPSYYAQVMFSNYVGAEVVDSALRDAGSRVFYSVTRDTAKRELYLKLVNASPESQPINIQLDGTASVQSNVTLITLHAATKEATNTISNPNNIVPVATTITRVGQKFQHIAPPYSIQVLKIGFNL
jgi:alpha-L-arabinofuranosidase